MSLKTICSFQELLYGITFSLPLIQLARPFKQKTFLKGQEVKVAAKSLEGLVKYVEKFHEENYIGIQIPAKEIAETLQVKTKFQEKSWKKR